LELRDSRIDEGWKVEIVHEGRSVSRTFIIHRLMRLGGAVLRTGGIGGVGTDEAFRHRGLARQVLERCVEVMAREAYDASFLFGIQDFYHRFGFATCMAEHEVSVATAAAQRVDRRLRLRPVRRVDLPALVRLYNRENGQRTISCVRSRTWAGFTRGTQWGVDAWSRVAVDGADKIRGYIACDDTTQRCKVAEVGGAHDDVHRTFLHLLGRRAAAMGVERIQLSLPPDHAFGLFLRQFGCEVRAIHPRNAGAMGRVIHLRPFLEQLRPELERRWPHDAAELALVTDLGTCALRRAARGGSLALSGRPTRGAPRLKLGQAALMQLACGYRSVEDCWRAGEVTGAARARRLAAELFPLQVGHMWWSDRF